LTENEKTAKDKELWREWLTQYRQRLEEETYSEEERQSLMAKNNPMYSRQFDYNNSICCLGKPWCRLYVTLEGLGTVDVMKI